MKRLLFSAQVILFGLFNFTLLITLFQLSGNLHPLSKFDYKEPVYNQIEEYNPSLSRISSLAKLEAYCDSLYTSSTASGNYGDFEKNYSEVVSSVIKERFYHGYSHYGFENNTLAMLFSTVTLSGYSAVVIPEDILKYPFAACSQQSIVMMELLKKKGIKTRKITFRGKKRGGHFSFEVFYNQSWHFYDTNMEPDEAILNAYNRPGIAFLSKHPELLVQIYRQYPREEILDILPNYTYGVVNEFPAPRAIVFQRLTKFLSYTIWLFFLLAFLLVRRRYKRITITQFVRKSRIYFPGVETGVPSSYYADLVTQKT
jgi:hypothetical protein